MPSPMEEPDDSELHRRLVKALESLDPLERRVIELRYGLLGTEQHSMNEASVALGLSLEDTYRLSDKALQRLKGLSSDQ